MVVIKKIVEIDYSNKISMTTILFLSIFPLSFFYNSIYADSIFLFMVSTSFYFARKRNWYLAGIFCGLATATRLSGVALIPALAVEWFLQNNIQLNKLNFKLFKTLIISLFLGCLGILCYMLYLQTNFDDAFLFQKSMSAWKQDGFIFPPQVVYRYLKIFLSVSPLNLIYWIAFLEFISFWLYMGVTYYVTRHIRVSYGVLMFVLLLLVTFTGTFAGTPRYLLHLFPGFLAIAIIVESRPRMKFIIIFSFLILGFILTGLFTRGYFIS
jgi:Gpi18-like mannosyltransferase